MKLFVTIIMALALTPVAFANEHDKGATNAPTTAPAMGTETAATTTQPPVDAAAKEQPAKKVKKGKTKEHGAH